MHEKQMEIARKDMKIQRATSGEQRNHESFHSLGGQILYKWRKNLTL
jgi:hypothetical protein